MKILSSKQRPAAARRAALSSLVLPLLALLTVCLVGCQSPSSNSFSSSDSGTAAPAAPSSTGDGRLNEGDIIRVAFEADTNMNTVAKLSLEGNITLPIKGDIKASGKTIEELKSDLMNRYADVLKNNEITVTRLESAASVTVSGAVLKPSRIPLDRPMTALDAIMEAGGYDPSRARLDRVKVLRIENGQQRTHTLNLKRAMAKGDPSPFYLKPFDNVYVPEKIFNF